MQVFARDPAGNEVVVPARSQVFPKPFGKSRIPIDDRFLHRVVPAIASNRRTSRSRPTTCSPAS